MQNAEMKKQDDGSIRIDLKITWEEINKEKDSVLDSQVAKSEIKGFRKGKAPRELVAKNLGDGYLTEESVKSLITSKYVKAINHFKLSPIMLPTIQIDKSDPGADWEIHAITCELPQILLGDYKDSLKQAISTQIWTPDKSTSESEIREKKISEIIDWLIKNIEFSIPDILIENESNHMLSRLVDQINSLGLTVDSYLASKNTTKDNLRSEFAQKARENLKIELILNHIAQEEKIDVTDAEIEKWIAATDQATAQIFQTESQQAKLRNVLIRKNTLDFLLQLA